MKHKFLLKLVNLLFISISLIIVFLCGVVRNDFFIDMELKPAYNQINNNIQRIEYLKEQELNYLMIAAAIVIVFIITNLIIRFCYKENGIRNKRITAAYISGFVLNLAAVFVSAAFLSSGLTMLCVENSITDARELMNTVHRMYLPIDILLFVLLIQLVIVLFIPKLPEKNKVSLMISAASPYLLYPLFFL